MVSNFLKNLEEEHNWFKEEDLKHGKLDQLETSSSLEDSDYGKIDQLKNQLDPGEDSNQGELNQLETRSSLEEYRKVDYFKG